MDNKEKAHEIASRAECNNLACWQCKEYCALAMAKWKDEQFEDTKDEIKVDVRKELSWEIHEKISNGATLAELDRYVCGICDF